MNPVLVLLDRTYCLVLPAHTEYHVSMRCFRYMTWPLAPVMSFPAHLWLIRLTCSWVETQSQLDLINPTLAARVRDEVARAVVIVHDLRFR